MNRLIPLLLICSFLGIHVHAMWSNSTHELTGVNPQITVSGISAGAFFAAQFAV
jgi:hypothetical protein